MSVCRIIEITTRDLGSGPFYVAFRVGLRVWHEDIPRDSDLGLAILQLVDRQNELGHDVVQSVSHSLFTVS